MNCFICDKELKHDGKHKYEYRLVVVSEVFPTSVMHEELKFHHNCWDRATDSSIKLFYTADNWVAFAGEKWRVINRGAGLGPIAKKYYNPSDPVDLVMIGTPVTAQTHKIAGIKRWTHVDIPKRINYDWWGRK